MRPRDVPTRPYAGVPAADRLDDRRQRLQAAVVRIVGRDGWSAATVRAVASEAGVGPRFLYESYTDVEDLAVHAYEAIGAQLIEESVRSLTLQTDVAAGIRAGVESIITALLADPDRTRFLLSETPRLAARRRALLETAADELARLTTENVDDAVAARRRAIFAAGGGLELVRTHWDGDHALDAASITTTISQALLADI